MMFSLIIDAGSTKMEWTLLADDKIIKRFATTGFNPNYDDIQQLNNTILRMDLSFKDKEGINKIFYYGSGCLKPENALMVGEVLKKHFPNSMNTVSDDMMGAAHALLGHDKGIVCILGTGANSCLYDGESITDRAVSLGYLLGDEGSGCYMGRKIVRAYFYELMPPELILSFKQTYNLNINDLIQHVYHEKGASKYLAQFTKFASQHQSHPFIQQLIKDCFADFIKVFVLRYKDCRSLPVSFVGSVALYFQDLLKASLESEGLSLGQIYQTPTEGLILYHVDN